MPIRSRKWCNLKSAIDTFNDKIIIPSILCKNNNYYDVEMTSHIINKLYYFSLKRYILNQFLFIECRHARMHNPKFYILNDLIR